MVRIIKYAKSTISSVTIQELFGRLVGKGSCPKGSPSADSFVLEADNTESKKERGELGTVLCFFFSNKVSAPTEFCENCLLKHAGDFDE